MTTSFTPDAIQAIVQRLSQANRNFAALYPGESEARQPIHTVYGGAHLFQSDTPRKLGVLALRSLEEFAPDFATFARALQLPGYETLPAADVTSFQREFNTHPEKARTANPGAWLACTVYDRVVEKLKREAVEDFRIDFEDGFGARPDAEEDETARTAALETARGMAENTLSPFIGIRIKPFSEELRARAIRTLDIYLTTLVGESGGRLPQNFVVTLPKVVIPEQVSALVELFEVLEKKLGLASGSLHLEIMVETTQSIINHQGRCALPELVLAARDRCMAAHLGIYDYTASCNITAAYQTMDHPACDFAREMMKVSLTGMGVWLSDGATNIMPVAPHRAEKGGPGLTPQQERENRDAVFSAWKLGYDHIRHSLKYGFYQGWDLHPAQFPIRYAACYTFFLEGFNEASERLRNFVDKAAKATLAGNVFDDAATGQGLLNYFLRALNCGAVTEEEALATGLTLAEIRGRSFAKILENRLKATTAV